MIEISYFLPGGEDNIIINYMKNRIDEPNSDSDWNDLGPLYTNTLGEGIN